MGKSLKTTSMQLTNSGWRAVLQEGQAEGCCWVAEERLCDYCLDQPFFIILIASVKLNLESLF